MKKYFHQLSLLLWKNFIIKKRSMLVFVFELTVPLVLFLIMVSIRFKQRAQPVNIAHYNAWPLPSAGFIPLMQSFCDPKAGIKNEYGFLEYPNSTVKIMVEQIEKLTKSSWSPDTLLNEKFSLIDFLSKNTQQTSQLFDILFNTNKNQNSNSRILLITNQQEDLFKEHRNDSITQLFNNLTNNIFNIPIDPQNTRIDLYAMFKYLNLTKQLTEIKRGDFKYKKSEYKYFICNDDDKLKFLNLNLKQSLCNLTINRSDYEPEFNDFLNNNINFIYYNEVIVKKFNQAIQIEANQTEQHHIRLLETNLNDFNLFKQAIDDLSALSLNFPRGLCNADQIIKEGEENKNKRKPESIESGDTGNIDYNTDLNKKNHGFLGLILNMKKTFCGIEPTYNKNKTKSNSNKSSSDMESSFSKDQLQSLGLLINVIYSNPVILFSPNTSVIQTNLIEKANKTFELLEKINMYCRRWLVQSDQLINHLKLNHTKNLNLNETNVKKLNLTNNLSNINENNALLDKIEIINSAACSWLSIMSGVNLDLFKGFANENDVVDYFLNRAYSNNQTVIASLIFDSEINSTTLSKHVKYTIRQNASFTPQTKKVRERYWYPSPRDWDYYYYLFGFNWLQDLIDRAIIDYHSNATVLEPGTYFQQMPYPCYMIDNFLQMIQHVMPLCLSISFVYTVSMLTQTIVIEKELRLKEVMKIMGLNNSCHLLAWFITYFLQFSFIMAIVTCILHFGKILTHSDPFLIFFLLELYATATICFSFLVSSLYSKAKLAAACAGILYFLSYVPCMYISIREDVALEIIPWWTKTFAALLSTSAFGMASKYIAFYENDGAGIQWHNMDKSPLESDQYTCYACVKVMILDCFLYWILAWYIENVNPSYGIPLKWYYPFRLSYWLGKDRSARLQDIENDLNNKQSWFSFFKSKRQISCTESNQAKIIQQIKNRKNRSSSLNKANASSKAKKTMFLFEQEPLNFRVGVSIHNLTKKYDDSKVAVDNLSINFYESQITSFLGHNGAGKSTTMSMLTGLIPATSGYALIYDKDIRTDINDIRNIMGFCPQHNVLFNLLTVEEHLWFYGQLKQMNDKSIKTLIENMLRDTGLTKKRNNLVSTLSGGMQRKLSVAIAFVGDANLVILDEPTAGVDPYARRAIWDLLLKYKTGRTIILSTHHMDEAELLGDRIGIISAGKLQCCGTSLFLKNALGEGNNLTIVKDMDKIQKDLNDLNSQNLIDLSTSSSSNKVNDYDDIDESEKISIEYYKKNAEKLTNFIQKYIPSAYLKDETLREYNLIIPLGERSNPSFWKLFNALDKEKSNLNIDSYGIHDVSLEEIFIKAAQIKTNEENYVLDDEPSTSIDDDDNDNENNSDEVSSLDSSNFSTESKKSLYNLDYIYNDLEIGYRFYLKQFMAMFVKRYLYNKRNWISLLTQIILPALFICVAMTVALAAPGFFDLPKMELTTAQFYPLTKPEGIYIPFSHSIKPHQVNNKCKTTKTDKQQPLVSASSIEIVKTLKFLIGISATCLLNSNNASLKNIINFNYNGNGGTLLNKAYFGETQQDSDLCNIVFNPNADIDTKYFELNKKFSLNKSSLLSYKKKYFPNCVCLKDFSGFECSPSNTYDQPPLFKTTTHETLLNISGSNESDYYLFTTDFFRLKRYGGLSFDNNNNNNNNNCSSDEHNNDPLISDSLKNLKLIQNLATNSKARVWYNNKGYHAMPTFLNVMNNALLRANVKKTLEKTTFSYSDNDLDLKASQYGITIYNHPMNQTNNHLSTEYLLEGSDVLISIFTIVAMSFVNASFVLFLVYERSIKSLHLQFLMGLNPFLYWLTNFIWDMLNYLLPASCVIIILKIFNVPAYVSGENYPAVILLFLLYGFSVSPLMYPMSFLFSEPSNAYIFLIVINLFTGITCVESSFLFQVFSFDKDLKFVYDMMKSGFLVFPPYCLGRGLIDIAYNDYYNTFYSKTGQFNKIRSPFEWDITTRNLIAMACIGVISWIFTLLLEYDFFKFKWCLRFLKATTTTSAKLSSSAIQRLASNIKEDIDVNNERIRIENALNETTSLNSLNNDRLILKSLRKIYYKKNRFSLKNIYSKLTLLLKRIFIRSKRYTSLDKKDNNEFVAVNNLTFGVPQGECFGLLGVNGAGKTTTFKMLTTDLEPSDGNIFINENNNKIYSDALSNKKKYWNQIGYCPQFDALYEELTPSDHIRLFARIKGIRTKYESVLCDSLLKRLDLTMYADKPVGSLSLGNKRKLSTAISFVGNPSIVLLDEPTSGMDPVSRRHLWSEIINLTRHRNCSVLLTSHSMEEVQVLSTRLAIMVEGKFKCMGSVQHLKTKFGDGYTLTVKIKDMPKYLVEVDDDEETTNHHNNNNDDKHKTNVKNKYISSILLALKENISPECKLKKRHFNNIYQFELPYSHSSVNFDIGSVYRLIELNKLRFNLADYSLSQNTLDNVFVNFVKEQTANKNKSKIANEDDEDDDDEYIDQNFVDHDDQQQTDTNRKNDNDDKLINLNDENTLDRIDFDISNCNQLNDQHKLLNQFSNMELMEIIEDDYC